MIVFYWDERSNLKRDLAKKSSPRVDTKSLVLVAATIDTAGRVTRDVSVDLSTGKFFPVPEHIVRVLP